MNRLDNKLAFLLNCRLSELADRLNHPTNIEKVDKFLNGKTLKTLYKNRAGEQQEFTYGGFTKKSARDQMAYNGFKRVTIDQHFYIKHRICLQFAKNPCVIERCSEKHQRLYPLELVKIKDEKDSEEENDVNCSRR